MKRYAVIGTATGACFAIRSAQFVPPATEWRTGTRVLEVADDVDATTHYFNGDTPVLFPAKPSPYHVWNWTTKAWEDSRTLDDLKAVKKAAIEAERDRRMGAVIVYSGANLQADPASLTRLNQKIAVNGIRTTKGSPPPTATLVWHDADNVDHTFADLPSYQDWLQGLALAIDARAMTAWAWSWDKKAQVDAATTADQVNAIDLTT